MDDKRNTRLELWLNEIPVTIIGDDIQVTLTYNHVVIDYRENDSWKQIAYHSSRVTYYSLQ